MKKVFTSFVFLLSVQLPVSAMMLSPVAQEERAQAKNRHMQRVKDSVLQRILSSRKAATTAENEKVHTLQKKINDRVCTTAQDVYQKINQNWTYPAPGDPMKVDSEYWNATWIGGESFIDGEKKRTKVPTLILKTSPEYIVEALEDLINKPAVLECTIALTTAKIFCMKDNLYQFAIKEQIK